MKISISKTELYDTRHAAWNEFVYFAMDNEESVEQLTAKQKTAAMCFWYYSDVCGDGHDGYFDFRENVDADEMAQALRTIGAPKFADNFAEAFKHGDEDDYARADEWFAENDDALFKAIEKYLRDNASEFYEIVEENYTMRFSEHFYKLGVIGAAFFFALAVIFLIVGGEALIAAAGFAAFGLLSAYIGAYAKMWKLVVKGDTLTVFLPLRQPREYRLGEISEVKQKQQKLVVYVDYRKVFAVDNVVSDYEIFEAQLRAAGKMEAFQRKNDFVVRQYKGNMSVVIVSLIFPVAVFFWVISFPDDMADIIKYMITTIVGIVPVWMLFQYLLWRITVLGDTMTVKYTFGIEKEYDFKEITRADLRKEKLILYAGSKKIAKVPYNCDGYQILIERLASEGIPFYEKGRLIESKF